MSRDDKRFLVGGGFLLLVSGIGMAVLSLIVDDWTPFQAWASVIGMCGGVFGLLWLAGWVAKKLVP